MKIENLWYRSCPPSRAVLNALRPFVACPPSASPSGEAGGARSGEAGGSLCFLVEWSSGKVVEWLTTYYSTNSLLDYSTISFNLQSKIVNPKG
ncbi:MAG: hypothetical protein KKH84_00965, partial [Proteobacteria bacterium]|nr:hypothetical protein [Pseudomonadota bacterium]